ncbi:MAG: transcription-repair coupling factor [Dissulfuribacterales bacterium]
MFDSLVDLLQGHGDVKVSVTGMEKAAAAWCAAHIFQKIHRPLVWLTNGLKDAERVCADLACFTDYPVLLFPSHENLPFVPIVPAVETVIQRISVLYQLAVSREPFLLVVPVQALCEPTVPRTVLSRNVEYIQTGEETDRDALVSWLLKVGYENVPIVQSVGQFSLRGGILDVYPCNSLFPVRLDFFGDFVEEMHYFDPLTQKSSDPLTEFTVLPCSELLFEDDLIKKVQDAMIQQARLMDWPARQLTEWMELLESRRFWEGAQSLLPIFYDGNSTVLDYLPEHTLFVMDGYEEVYNGLYAFWETARHAYESARASFHVLSELSALVLPPDVVFNRVHACATLSFSAIGIERQGEAKIAQGEQVLQCHSTSRVHAIESLVVTPSLPVPVFHHVGEELLRPVWHTLAEWAREGKRVAVFARSILHRDRLLSLLGYYAEQEPKTSRISLRAENEILDYAPPAGAISLFVGSPSKRFYSPAAELIVISEDELFGGRPFAKGKKATRKADKRTKLADVVSLDITHESLIVHRDYGVGRYKGLVRMDLQGVQGEFLYIEYRDGDRLYLPVDRLGLVQRYVGIDGREPALDKLGGSAWQLKQKKVRKAVYEVAHELVELYARRQVQEGIVFSEPDAMYRQFEAAFPYDETPDQASAIEDVLKDMQSPVPMDRLICGDVGYGKTEVVMRAAFKAVSDGKQVAVLVPTTLLAEQHERSFKARFEKFPVRIAALNRLKSPRQIKETLTGLASGQIDIVIGTHRLLQKDVQFRSLGLLVVDEEHRFGVKHKEKLKGLKQHIDCLTLTATPIPRTLQLSLLGLRDMSIIKTPPQDRLPIKTFVAEFDDTIISQAIKRELERNGQIFFVRNRIQGIERLAEHVRTLVPGIRVEVAHGQMDASQLEDVMIRFVRGEIDCLVCTAIIESGIDIPAANTILIDRADLFGVAELYQLRGRVGRSTEQAYAYFFVPPGAHTEKGALKRIKAVMDSISSGGGFALAMEDLQMRGAGNIIGMSQSGQIAEVGYELYLNILEEAVQEIKGQPIKRVFDPEVNLGVSAFIPEEYCPDIEERLRLYRRLSRIESEDEAAEFERELTDRFGEYPQEVTTLLQLMAIKRVLVAMNCSRLDKSRVKEQDMLVLTYGPEGPVNLNGVLSALPKHKTWRLLPDGRLMVPLQGKGLNAVLDTVQMIKNL